MNRRLSHKLLKVCCFLSTVLGFVQFWFKWTSPMNTASLALTQRRVILDNSYKSEPRKSTANALTATNSSTTVKLLSLHDNFLKAAKKRAVNNTLIMCYFDSSVLDVALNFHETSVARLGLKNVLFVGSSHACCTQLNSLDSDSCVVYPSLQGNIVSNDNSVNTHSAVHSRISDVQQSRFSEQSETVALKDNVVRFSNIKEAVAPPDLPQGSYSKNMLQQNAFTFPKINSAPRSVVRDSKKIGLKGLPLNSGDLSSRKVKGEWEQESLYGSNAFNRKMDVRTELILTLLEVGLTVLHTDIDVYFVHNPLDYIKCAPPHCHIATLMDKPDLYNAGFVYVRPTDYGKAVYSKMRLMTTRGFYKFSDQDQLRIAINDMKHRTGFHHVPLPPQQFQSGLRYFEEGFRHFTDDNPCVACVVIHNNFLVTSAAKVYRARETGLWTYEGEDQYYSSLTRKYLRYSNPHDFANFTINREVERRSLSAALALTLILNRTLILPRFHCDNDSWCSLLSHYRLTAFEKHFGRIYREYSFIKHPKIPSQIRHSVSTTYLIATDRALKVLATHGKLSNVTIVTPRDKVRGATDREIIRWFATCTESVLHLHSLYDAFSHFEDKNAQQLFEHKIAEALQSAPYKQTK